MSNAPEALYGCALHGVKPCEVCEKSTNEWYPWKEEGITELAYYHKLYLESSKTIEELETKILGLEHKVHMYE